MGRRRERPAERRTAAGGGPCPCGLPAGYDACCGRLHRGTAAATAEQLMRARYSAYARGDEAYLRASWHPSTRPGDLDLDPALRWTGLVVLAAAGGLLDPAGFVHFRASHLRQGVPGVLEERSRFVRDGGRWVYLAPVG